MMAGDPYQCGVTWVTLQYVLGLRRLGHDVWFMEPVKDASGREFFRELVAEFDLENRAALLLEGTRETIGVRYEEFPPADILINTSGMITDEKLLGEIPKRIYLDIDPGFNQLWHAVQGIDRRFKDHTHFVTVGQAIGD